MNQRQKRTLAWLFALIALSGVSGLALLMGSMSFERGSGQVSDVSPDRFVEFMLKTTNEAPEAKPLVEPPPPTPMEGWVNSMEEEEETEADEAPPRDLEQARRAVRDRTLLGALGATGEDDNDATSPDLYTDSEFLDARVSSTIVALDQAPASPTEAHRLQGFGVVDRGGGKGSGGENRRQDGEVDGKRLADFKKKRPEPPEPEPSEPATRDGDWRAKEDVAPDKANLRAFKPKPAPKPAPKRPPASPPMITSPSPTPGRYAPPRRFLPRMFYFENTYLGGDAAHLERLRRLEVALAAAGLPIEGALGALGAQPFDPPEAGGLALSATLAQGYVDRPQRVLLQVGLQGSQRFGWRRPPLDLILILDAVTPDEVEQGLKALLSQLDARDRLGVISAEPQVHAWAGLATPEEIRAAMIERLRPMRPGDAGALAAAMRLAGEQLQAAGAGGRVPGTQTVLLLTGSGEPARVRVAQRAAHQLNLQGVVTSVLSLAGREDRWWEVAAAGHGNLHRATDAEGIGAGVRAEIESLSRVIARLLRVNVRLAKGVKAIRVLGSRVLAQEEVKRVKAREVATDRRLSETMGVAANRGEDDDGVQTVIPYFYGGDAHVILIELWVEQPGAVADVTLKYKDMVLMRNATARASVHISALPSLRSPGARVVLDNARGFELAEQLAEIQRALDTQGDRRAAARMIAALATPQAEADQAMLARLQEIVDQSEPKVGALALRVASARRIGASAPPQHLSAPGRRPPPASTPRP
ncbi:VWA domain-containing protein [Myxococcota bacterium]|nr:VWA domain-containing protein [Myxococcota bacterium]MBU1897753.1 VWA domain-containing protein [Myxococcota bacterium]